MKTPTQSYSKKLQIFNNIGANLSINSSKAITNGAGKSLRNTLPNHLIYYFALSKTNLNRSRKALIIPVYRPYYRACRRADSPKRSFDTFSISLPLIRRSPYFAPFLIFLGFTGAGLGAATLIFWDAHYQPCFKYIPAAIQTEASGTEVSPVLCVEQSTVLNVFPRIELLPNPSLFLFLTLKYPPRKTPWEGGDKAHRLDYLQTLYPDELAAYGMILDPTIPLSYPAVILEPSLDRFEPGQPKIIYYSNPANNPLISNLPAIREEKISGVVNYLLQLNAEIAASQNRLDALRVSPRATQTQIQVELERQASILGERGQLISEAAELGIPYSLLLAKGLSSPSSEIDLSLVFIQGGNILRVFYLVNLLYFSVLLEYFPSAALTYLHRCSQAIGFFLYHCRSILGLLPDSTTLYFLAFFSVSLLSFIR